MKKKDNDTHQLSKHRLEALTDGIYAFAMTLLLLTFNLPASFKGMDIADVDKLIFSQSDRFFNYALSFVLLTVFWLINQQMFNHLKKTDHRHIWINAFTLMFVVFIPFSTSLVNEFSNQTPTEFMFALNLFVISILLSLGHFYAVSEKRLIHDKADMKHIKRTLRFGAVMPLISAAAMIMAFINPEYCSYIYLLIPVFLILPIFK